MASRGVTCWMAAVTRKLRTKLRAGRWLACAGWMMLVLVCSAFSAGVVHAETPAPDGGCLRADQRLVSQEHDQLFRIESSTDGTCDRLVVYALGSRARLSSHALPGCGYGCVLGPLTSTANPRLLVLGQGSFVAYDIKRRRLGDTVTPTFRGEAADAQSGTLSFHGLMRGRFLLCYVVDSGVCLFDLGRTQGPAELAHVDSAEDHAGLFSPFPGVHIFRESPSLYTVVYGRKTKPTMLRARRLSVTPGIETFTCERLHACHDIVLTTARSYLVIDLRRGKRYTLPRGGRSRRATLEAFVGRAR